MTALAATVALSTSAHAASFSYANFSDTTGLSINGDASVVNVGGSDVLQLTPALADQGGSVFSTDAIALSNNYSFSTSFTFNISDNSDTPYGPIGADGIAFVLQTVSNNVGSTGGAMGYGGISPSLEIEFDTYSNSFDPERVPDDLTGNNHIAITTNGDATTWLAYTNVSSTLNLSGGDDISVFIDYNGLTGLLEVRWSTVGVRPQDAGLSYTIDLASLFGTDSVYVGFTGGTGANWSEQDVLNWAFADNYDPTTSIPTETIPAGSSPTGAVPEPATWAMMIAGFGLAGGATRRKRRQAARCSLA